MLRNGQWVKFTIGDSVRFVVGDKAVHVDNPATLEMIRSGAHKAGDSLVGIHVRGGKDPFGVQDGGGVQLVKPDTGTNFMLVFDDKAIPVMLSVDSCEGIEAVTDREDIPRDRLATAPEGWKPRP